MIRIIFRKIHTFLDIYIGRLRRYFLLINVKEKGKNISLCFPLTIQGRENISIGNNTAIGHYVHIWGSGGVTIGSDVLIAAHCCITSLGHDVSRPLMRQSVIAKPVIIGDGCWLGYNVTVLPGVTIGKGSVIGAGSVVTKDIPPMSVAVGNPAKVLKKREIINE
jgi:acetyltransferase-like isoleucine patch superfamily enzyme